MPSRWLSLLCTTAAGGAACLALAFPADHDRLLYNHSPSLPIGFYVRSESAAASRGAIVTVLARNVAPAAARARDFAGARDRFLKRVVATSGDEICADGATIRINGIVAAERRSHDSGGQPLPAWQGCRVLDDDEIFLLGETAASFDGRYWGPIRRADIEGVWRPLL